MSHSQTNSENDFSAESCPNGHGLLKITNGKEHCWTCGWPDQIAVEKWKSQSEKRSNQKKQPTVINCANCGIDVEITPEGKCSICMTKILPDTDHEATFQMSSGVDEQKMDNEFLLEVWFPSGDTFKYKDLETFKKAFYNGTVRRDYKAREPSDTINEKNLDEKWRTVSEIAKSNDNIRSLFRPVNSSIKNWLQYGVMIGIILKALDTTYTFFLIHPIEGYAWLFIVGGFFALQTKFADKVLLPAVIIIFASLKNGIPLDVFTNKFMAVFFTVLVGAFFGMPLGSILGAIVGFFKKISLKKMADIEDEGAKPFILGLVLPFTFLVFAIPFWIFWLTPKMMEWMHE